uniref:Uncharacterized protein n=1 Tax=Rhizophora mucronata TaxID=61149 RepID=A0A2P2PWB4_RHIMU
MKGKSLWPNCR